MGGANTMAVIAVVRATNKTSLSIARVAHVLTLKKHRSLLTARHAREHAVLQNTKVMAIVMMETTIADASMMVETAAERAVMEKIDTCIAQCVHALTQKASKPQPGAKCTGTC